MATFDPAALAHQIWANWSSERLLRKEKKPDPVQLSMMLETSYEASFNTDEGRPTRFSLILMTERDAAEEDYFRAKLGERLPLSVPIIGQMAPATELSCSLIGVEEGESRPWIWGIMTPGSDWGAFQRGEETSGTAMPMRLVVTTFAPGSLEVRISDWPIWSIHRGKLAKPGANVLKAGPIHDFFRPAIDDLLDELFPAVSQRDDSSTKFFRVSYGGDYRRLITRILSTVEATGHGGTVIFVKKSEIPRVDSLLNIKYRTPGFDLRSVVAERMKATFDSIEAWKTLTRMDNLDKKALLAWKKEEVRQDKTGRRLLDAAEFVARLTQVDGALVITDELEVVGFGAMVGDLSRAPEEFHECRDEAGGDSAPVLSQSYGSRHRSAMSFCALTDAVAFVMSEDGGVKAIRQVSDRLCVWPSIYLDPRAWFVTAEDIIPALSRASPSSGSEA